MKKIALFFLTFIAFHTGSAQEPANTESPKWQGKFEQLGQTLPTPNEYRSGSGSPGPKYWQQKADYVIQAELHDDTQHLEGSEVILYTNNSPDALRYLWLHMDPNINQQGNNSAKTATSRIRDSVNAKEMAGTLGLYDFDGGDKIKTLKNQTGGMVKHTASIPSPIQLRC